MNEMLLDGFRIEISDGLKAYNPFRKKYKNKATAVSEEFDKKFSVLFDDMDELYARFPLIAQGYLEEIVDVALRDVIQAGINDISDEVFITKYVTPRNTWQEDYQEIEDEYLAIVLDSEKYEEYKKARDNNRGPGIMGGGFGVEGAAAGIAIATAANFASNALGGMIDSASDGLRSFNERIKKSELFNNPNTREHLVSSIFKLVFQVHLAVIDVIVEKKGKTDLEPVSANAHEQAKAIVQNIKRGRIENENIKESLVDAIRLDPYYEETYRIWLEKYGDGENGYFELIDYFDIPISKGTVVGSTSEKTLAPSNSDLQAIGESEGSVTIQNNTNNENDDLKFDGKVYDSVEEATRIRVEYVEKFLRSGKDIDAGKKEELNKIFKGDENVKKVGLIGGLGFLVGILIMVFHSPWWHGLIAVIVFTLVFGLFDKSVKKGALKRWLEMNRR